MFHSKVEIATTTMLDFPAALKFLLNNRNILSLKEATWNIRICNGWENNKTFQKI